MIRFVRAVIYILVLAAIGWFVSKIYIDPEFQTAIAPAVETIPARTVAVAAVETAPALSEATPPAPLAKAERSADDTATAPAEDTTSAAAEAAPPATLADAGDYVEPGNGEAVVDVPTTRVETGGDKRTRVRVSASYTKVDVDTKRRRVRIRVPYYNGDIRW